jgi:hypothetical protein
MYLGHMATGIQARIQFASSTHAIAEAAPAIAESAGGMYRLRIAIDGGEEQVFGVHERPIIACVPGEHDVMVALGDFLGKLSIVRFLTKHTIRVRVEPGQVTEVSLQGGAGDWTLSEIGKHPG